MKDLIRFVGLAQASDLIAEAVAILTLMGQHKKARGHLLMAIHELAPDVPMPETLSTELKELGFELKVPTHAPGHA